MTRTVEVLLTPAEISLLPQRDLNGTASVVFDVLRATSAFVTALANGAEAIVPAAEIEEALRLRQKYPDSLLAGEREGRRITACQSGGVEFDLGNSPREFTRGRIQGRTIISTTTNGTRALKACSAATEIFIGSFLNLEATHQALLRSSCPRIQLLCAGTGEDFALEDALAAGALCERLQGSVSGIELSDSALATALLYGSARQSLTATVRHSRNAKRLLSLPDLADDVEFCLAVDSVDLVARMRADGAIRIEK